MIKILMLHINWHLMCNFFHKLNSSTGTEMTPSSKYDFKFKDYAPWVFRDIREIFHIDPAEYLVHY